MKRVIAVMALLVLGAALSACGGDTDAPITPAAGTSTAVTPLSKSAFIKQADSNCDDAYTSLANIDSSTTSTATSTTATSDSSQTSEKKNTIDGLVEQLKGLQVPAGGDEQSFNQFISDLEKASKALDEQTLAEKRSDTSASDTASSDFDSAMSDARSAAGQFGLKVCSKEGTASSTSSGGNSSTTTTPSSVTPSAPVTPAPAPATPVPAPAPAPAPPAGGGGTGGGGGISP